VSKSGFNVNVNSSSSNNSSRRLGGGKHGLQGHRERAEPPTTDAALLRMVRRKDNGDQGSWLRSCLRLEDLRPQHTGTPSGSSGGDSSGGDSSSSSSSSGSSGGGSDSDSGDGSDDKHINRSRDSKKRRTGKGSACDAIEVD
jgi:hypothetical protein